MAKRWTVVTLLTVLCFPFTVFANDGNSGWSLSVASGVAYNASTRLNIKQDNQPTLEVKYARYRSRPLSGTPLYDIRLGNWSNGAAWELEWLHHKLLLENKPGQVQRFDINHYNMLFLNRAWLLKHQFRLHIGGGVVIAKPENTVRNLTEEGKNRLSGLAGQVDAGRRFYVLKHVFLLLDGKVTYSWAPHIKVANGHAKVTNIGLFAIAGVGIS